MKQPLLKKLADRYVVVNQLQMHYCTNFDELSAESKPVLILLHGLTVSYRYMCPTAQHLSNAYTVYLPDLPGFGKSAKPRNALTLDQAADTLVAWMDAVGLEQANFLGNSLGCQILVRLAVRHPERVTRLILTAPTMDIHARTAHQESVRWMKNMVREPLSLYPIVLRDFLDIGLRRFIQTFRYGLQDQIEHYLPLITVPTLVVRGSLDTIVSQGWTEEVTRLLPNGRLLVIPEAAHDVNYNAPRQLARCVRVFLHMTSPE